MRIVLQRVISATVKNGDKIISSINKGYVLLVGIVNNENEKIVDKMVDKILKAKLFGRWEKSIVEMEYQILVISQFILFGQLKGRKPDFHRAEDHYRAKEIFFKLVNCFQIKYEKSKVECGDFGVFLQICMINDGPFTLILDELQ